MAKLRLLIYICIIVLGILIMQHEVVQLKIVDKYVDGWEYVKMFWYGLPVAILGVLLILFDAENLIKEIKGNATN